MLLIVFGHVVAVFAAHRLALRTVHALVRALAMQLPLVALMVAYTVAGLWVPRSRSRSDDHADVHLVLR